MQAIVIDKNEQGYQTRLTAMESSQLPAGDVHIQVDYSTLNYKDSLAITGKSPVVRQFPMVPGIDLAGTVLESSHAGFQPGDQVVLNGFGVGEVHWGGLAQQARVNGDWLLHLPQGITTRQAMAIGTAGYTAMLCIRALQHQGITPDTGELLVTGAAGGVGSIAIAVLAQLGYTVVASSGRSHEHAFLQGLGASEVIQRSELSEPGRPLGKERWAGVIDTVGSHTLANACATTHYGGAVAACGLAQGFDLPATVMPFILRGVKLLGIDSVYCSLAERKAAWHNLADYLDADKLASMTSEIGMTKVLDTAKQQLAGQVRGRCVVNVNS